jgi:hypothetical protein
LHRDWIEGLERTASDDERWEWGFFGYDFPEFEATATAVRRPFPGLLREVVGNPLCRSRVDPAWLAWNGGTVPKPAQAIYDGRAFERLPVLADALEDAGCADQQILSHCRQPGEHVRGCWVLDLLLGKE